MYIQYIILKNTNTREKIKRSVKLFSDGLTNFICTVLVEDPQRKLCKNKIAPFYFIKILMN